MGEKLRVILANEPIAYREAPAEVRREVRPHLEALLVEPEEVGDFTGFPSAGKGAPTKLENDERRVASLCSLLPPNVLAASTLRRLFRGAKPARASPMGEWAEGSRV